MARGSLKEKRYKDFLEDGYVMCGSPATVRDQLRELCRTMRVGNLMVLLHMGSMPHELTMDSISMFCADVLPKLRDIWDDEGWVNHWWPQRLRGTRAV